MKQSKQNSFRIIAGEWRRRRLALSPNLELRPTPERVRETLFNWLGHDVIGANCLDLFAGSGALGLEALSRGAKHVSFVELDRSSANEIRNSLSVLKVDTEKYDLRVESAINYLAKVIKAEQAYDIIFLDPPFRKNWWQELSPLLVNITHEDSLIYLEVEKGAEPIELPENWSIFREKTAGQVRYYLLHCSQSD